MGDFVVHVRHGVGTFQGLVRKSITVPDGLRTRTIEQDYVELEYRRGDRMSLPVTRLDEVYKYRAIGNKQPRLDKLGGATWATKRSKACVRIANLAHQLLRLHAHRAVADGFTYDGLPPAYLSSSRPSSWRPPTRNRPSRTYSPTWPAMPPWTG